MMDQTQLLSQPKRLIKIVFWIFLIVFAADFVIDVFPYFGLQQEVFHRYWNFKWWLVGHITGGLLALVIGPFQFSETFRKKYLSIHRWLGRIYLIAILVGTLSSSYLAWTSALAIHWTWALALQSLAFAWIGTAGMAYLAIMKGRIQIHKEWMIRSYVVTFAFVTFRWLLDLPAIVQLGKFIERGPTIAWVSWVIPLLVTNIILDWKRNK